jgi:AAA domain
VRSTENYRDAEAAERTAASALVLAGMFGGDCPVIVIDTFTAALGAGGSDCDPKDVSAFLEHVKKHMVGHGFTVIVIHHTGKDASRGGRGWSGLNAALDFELEIDRDGDLRTMRVTKNRDGSDMQPAFCYELEAHPLGLNQHGEPVTAVVVRHLADQEKAKTGKRLSPKARSALNVLWAMIKDRTKSFPMPDDAGKRCVMLTDWERDCIAPDAISRSHEERDRRKQFRAAKDELEAGNFIVCDGEGGARVYPAPKEARE